MPPSRIELITARRQVLDDLCGWFHVAIDSSKRDDYGRWLDAALGHPITRTALRKLLEDYADA